MQIWVSHGIRDIETCWGICVKSLDPIEFNEIPEIFGLVSSRVGMDEVQYMDFHIFQAVVIRAVEVVAYFTVRPVMTNVVEMGLESVHKAIFRLSYILYPASLAGEAVYEIGALTSHVVFCGVVPTRSLAGDSARFVEFGAVSAGPWVARVARGSILRSGICGLFQPSSHL